MPCLNKHRFDKYCLLLISIGHFLEVRRAIFVLLLVFVASPSTAQPFSEWASQQALQFLEDYSKKIAADKGFRSDYKIGNIDPRLNLAACEKPLEITFQSDPLERNKNTLRLTCHDQKRWSIFVGAKIDIFNDVWVASQTLPRGYRVKKSDLERDEIQINQSRQGYFVNPQNIVGMTLKRSIQAGNVFYPGLLIPPKVIERGDTVVISALSNTISVQMMGVALSDGKLGQQISVRNKKSDRVVRATVISKGKVSVPM
ncbi:flagellar basal body P-ring formation chaperone FlgA [Alkalimarinus sediminis]